MRGGRGGGLSRGKEDEERKRGRGEDCGWGISPK